MRWLINALVDCMSFGAALRVGPWLFANRSLGRTLAFERERIHRVEDWFTLISPEDPERHFELYMADRAMNWAQTRVVPLPHQGGGFRYAAISASRWGPVEFWIIADVTAEVSSAEQARVLFEKSPSPNMIYDERGITDCNAASLRFLGYEEKSGLLGRHPGLLSPRHQPDGRLSREKADEMDELARKNGYHRFDWMPMKADGTLVMVEASLTPLTLPSGPAMLCTWTDIQDRYDEQVNLQRAKDTAEAHLAARQSFLATMSHELRTPMNGVLGLTESLLEGDNLNPEQREALEAIDTSGRILRQLLNDILDYSKFEAGELRLESLRFDLDAVGRNVVGLHSGKARGGGVELSWHFQGRLPHRIGDPVRVQQILSNLVSNAVKFTEAGSVEVAALAARNEVCIEVRDTGVGMSSAQSALIFDPFRQADASTTRRFGGTGLGLAIVKQLVDSMRGSIEVSSSPGRGTTFRVRLPLPGVQAPDPSTQAARGELQLPRRVLVAEDNRVNRLVLKRMLSKLPIELSFVDDGSQVGAAVAEICPDIILMDVHMPEMDGLEATRRLRQSGYRGPIYALTASCLDEELRACLEAGMNEVLSKPVDRRTLVESLARSARTARTGRRPEPSTNLKPPDRGA